jgi:Protein of unknown function (DUF2934)
MNQAEIQQDKLTPEKIAALAYEIWQQGGCKPGTDLENWLEAEKKLKVSSRLSAKPNNPPPAPQEATIGTGSTKNHLRRTTNVRLQNNLAPH